jgi:hypothetical protein
MQVASVKTANGRFFVGDIACIEHRNGNKVYGKIKEIFIKNGNGMFEVHRGINVFDLQEDHRI